MQAGDRVGNYILNELVGRGAFAEVWQAHHHERPASVVAVKIATAPEFRRQLMREGRLPDIDDPHVVPILDSDTRLAAAPYIVMPYYPAGSLAELIARHHQGLAREPRRSGRTSMRHRRSVRLCPARRCGTVGSSPAPAPRGPQLASLPMRWTGPRPRWQALASGFARTSTES
jgi:hypothetical protein